MAKYVAHHGISRAAGYFSRKLGVHISTSTLQYIRDCYIRELNKKQAQEEDDDPITSLPLRKRGRRLMIGEVVDSKVQAYLKKVHYYCSYHAVIFYSKFVCIQSSLMI